MKTKDDKQEKRHKGERTEKLQITIGSSRGHKEQRKHRALVNPKKWFWIGGLGARMSQIKQIDYESVFQCSDSDESKSKVHRFSSGSVLLVPEPKNLPKRCSPNSKPPSPKSPFPITQELRLRMVCVTKRTFCKTFARAVLDICHMFFLIPLCFLLSTFCLGVFLLSRFFYQGFILQVIFTHDALHFPHVLHSAFFLFFFSWLRVRPTFVLFIVVRFCSLVSLFMFFVVFLLPTSLLFSCSFSCVLIAPVFVCPMFFLLFPSFFSPLVFFSVLFS